MMLPVPFTLHRSAAATVRTEPPDLVIVEGPALGSIRFRRAHLRQCSAMLVRVYRERHDASFAATNDDDIVIRLQLEGSAMQLLGLFAHGEGSAIADALRLTRRELLFAAPGFSVSVSPDDAFLVIATCGHGGHASVPVPTSGLHELVVRDHPPPEVRYQLPTGFEPTAASHWIELAFWRATSWSLGPLSADDAATLAHAFRTWRAEHPIDLQPTVVDPETLAAAPSRWHSRRIDVTARWHYAFEHSSFVGAWLAVPEHAPVTEGTYRARVVGTWIYPAVAQERGYGHMGCSPGVLRAETIEVLEVYERPRDGRDGLTGLPKRDALGAAFEHEARLAVGDRRFAVALLDLDRFKRINDTYGYKVGDEVLRIWASAVVGALGPRDVVVRWGGEELAVLLPDATLETARETLERVVARMRALVIAAGEHRIGVTVSAGVAEVARGEAVGAAVERADRALYQAKRAGRDRVETAPRVD